MRIYTRGGDRGETGLPGGERVPKDDPRVAAYGTVDELNSAIGCARQALRRSGTPAAARIDATLRRIQSELFDLGAELAAPARPGRIAAAHIERLEEAIDAMEAGLPRLTHFILPAGAGGAAELHLARTIARRAERAAVSLAAAGSVRPEAIAYLNRLSDYLFVAARSAAFDSGEGDEIWLGDRES